MLRDIRKSKLFNRRTLFIGASQGVLGSALIARLSYLQLIKHQEYSIQSDSNRIKQIISPAPRGAIVDRFGFNMVNNESNYRLFLYLSNRKINLKSVDKLVEILNLNQEQKDIFLAKIKNARRKNVISLIDNLSWKDLTKIESNYHLLSGLSIETGVMRSYPYPNETAHFIGYVSLPSDKEINNNEQNLFMHPDFRIGKSGIERSFDEALRGNYGVKYVEVNVHEVPIRNLSSKQAIEGSRVHLTIDFRLQKFATERIKNDVASVILMDVESGEILVYASSPAFDPNRFVEGVTHSYWKELNSDIRKPLTNKPISALYPPGSTFKLMTAIAGLENGINPQTKVNCNGYYKFGRRAFHCWKEGGHGSLNLVDAIMHSCNTYFFTIANQIGAERIAEVSKRFGYAEKPDISLHGAKTGVAPNDEWKRKALKQQWFGGDTLNTAIGQGFVLASPLQMAVITSRIANGGVPIKPYLVRNQHIFTQFDQLKSKRVVSEEHLKLIKEGMNRVMNTPGGTAFAKRIEIKGFEMAGKTGTSQVISKREDEMTASENALKANQNHAIFVGFAPVSKPRYAISVVVEHGKSGSQAAAPIGRDILLEAQKIQL